jgi:hypothetical protein
MRNAERKPWTIAPGHVPLGLETTTVPKVLARARLGAAPLVGHIVFRRPIATRSVDLVVGATE